MTAQATVHELRQGIAPAIPNQAAPPITVGFDTLAGFELTQRVAKMFASSSLMPEDYQNNIANCAIALNMAARIGADPMMVAQNLYVVHGRPGWSAQFMIATFNACGRFSSIRYEFQGQEGTDEWKCRAWAMEKETEQRIEGAWVSIGLAKKSGWHDKTGSKWKTMPMQMLMYRAASWFIRAYAPEIAMGIQTVDEVRDTWDMREESPGVYTVTTEDIRQAEAAIEAEVVPDTIDLPTQPDAEPVKAKGRTSKPDTQAQAEPRQVTCPIQSDSEGEPVRVFVTACDGCGERQGCPSWE